ncbi:MAG: PadR family transcriptional regulator [Parvibaculum sp.]
MDVGTLCLGALEMGDATGYEIKKMFESGLFSHFLDASFGSIYPALTKLTDEGSLTCTSQQQERRPDKKIYSITPAGREALKRRLQQPISGDRLKSEFLFVMLFADALPQETVTTLLTNRLAELRDELTNIQAKSEEPLTSGQEFVRRYGEVVMEASLNFIRDNRHLVENPMTTRALENVR